MDDSDSDSCIIEVGELAENSDVDQLLNSTKIYEALSSVEVSECRELVFSSTTKHFGL